MKLLSKIDIRPTDILALLAAMPMAWVTYNLLLAEPLVGMRGAIPGAIAFEAFGIFADRVTLRLWNTRKWSVQTVLGVLLVASYGVLALYAVGRAEHSGILNVFPFFSLGSALLSALGEDVARHMEAEKEAIEYARVIDERNAELARQERMEKYRLRKQLEHEEKMAELQLQTKAKVEAKANEARPVNEAKAKILEYLEIRPDATNSEAALALGVDQSYVNKVRKQMVVSSNGHGGNDGK